MGFGLWFRPGLYLEGLRWCEQALARSDDAAPAARVAVLDGAATLAIFQGNYERAADFIADELRLVRQLGDPLLLVRALTAAGLLEYRRGAYGEAEALVEEAHRIVRAQLDDDPEATLRLAIVLLELGDIALAQEQVDQAAEHYEEAIPRAQFARNLWVMIDAQTGLAASRVLTGSFQRAAHLYRDSLDRAGDVGAIVLMSSVLLGLAAIAAASGLHEEGARLLGAAEGIAAFVNAPFFPRDQHVFKSCLAALTSSLAPEQFVAARKAGRVLSVESAIAEAKAIATAATATP
jgi:tetratricopeptide (TPR) repeat protein